MNLIKEPISSLLKKIAIPASVATLFQTLFNIVDTFFAGKISSDALSALAKSFPIYFILIAASVGVTVGGTSLIANSIGEKNKENVLRYFGQTIIYGIVLSVLVTIIGLFFASDIFMLMGSSLKVMNLGLEYTNVIFSGSIIFISVVALNSLLHAEGDTKTFRNVLILSFFLNIFLNPLFIFGYGPIPAMGRRPLGPVGGTQFSDKYQMGRRRANLRGRPRLRQDLPRPLQGTRLRLGQGGATRGKG